MNVDWNTIKAGDEASFTATVTEETAAQFAEITGDNNPLHVDSSFAAQRGFSKKVAHGMLLASFFSRLAGKHFLQDNNLYLSQTAAFRKPVFVGDTVTVRGVVTEKSESTKTMRIKTVIESPSGEQAVVGEAHVAYRE